MHNNDTGLAGLMLRQVLNTVHITLILKSCTPVTRNLRQQNLTESMYNNGPHGEVSSKCNSLTLIHKSCTPITRSFRQQSFIEYMYYNVTVLVGLQTDGDVQAHKVLALHGQLNHNVAEWRTKYSRLSLSRNRRDPQKQFEISVLRHIRFVVLRKKQFEQPIFTNDYVI